jgi:periplasmic mercuric ion binding protein
MLISRLSLLAVLGASSAIAAEPKTATLDVPGMYCSLCQVTVRTALERVPGVIEAKADNKSKRAEVKYDPDRTSPEALAKAVSSAGFSASVRAQ